MGPQCVGGTCLTLSIHSDGRLRAHSWRFDAVQCRRSSCVSARIRAIFIAHELSNRRGREKVSRLHREKADILRRHDTDLQRDSIRIIYHCANKFLIKDSKAGVIYIDLHRGRTDG